MLFIFKLALVWIVFIVLFYDSFGVKNQPPGFTLIRAFDLTAGHVNLSTAHLYNPPSCG